jgi:AcrR family transcriptional regulator
MSEPLRFGVVARSGGRTRDGKDTKTRIVDAALTTLLEEGIVGTSARAIARRGGFNQALIFYHFGSIEEVLLALVDRLSEERLARYRERLEGIATLPELVMVAGELHAADTEEGHILVLSQLLAGSVSSPEFGEQLRRRFDPWTELVAGAIRRVIAGTPYESFVPVDDLALTVTALFVGIELFSRLGDDGRRTDGLFPTIGMMAALLGQLLEQQPASAPVAAPKGRGKKSTPR